MPTAQARAVDCCPNLFIVGVARGGTTSLADYLGQHPDVFVAAVKEPYFFTRYHPDWVDEQEESGYLSLFRLNGGARYRCEATTAYFWDGQSARSILDASPQARIVISLREPVERAFSEFLLLRRSTHERRSSFLAAVWEEMQLGDKERGDDPRYNYVSRGLYAEGVARFFDTFGRDRVHVLFFEEFATNTRAEMRALFEFLDLDSEWADRIDLSVRNRGGVARNKLAGKLLYSPPARAVGRVLVPPIARSWVERALMRPAKPDSDVAQASQLLRQLYAADRRRLERLLGRQVPW